MKIKYSLITTGFNCSRFVEENILSLLNQNYDLNRFEIIAVNDGSLDNTLELLKQFEGIKILDNGLNMGAAFSRWRASQEAEGEILCFIGMDDLLTRNALQVLDRYYSDPSVRMTWGSWKHLNGSGRVAENYPDIIWREKSFRVNRWRATALQTFKKELVDRVPIELLKDSEGRWLTNCTDLAIGFPCLELCKPHEARVIKEFIYLYRSDHSNTTLNRFGRKHKSEIREYLKRIKPLKK